MKEKTAARETVTLSSMLFGMFFGAGNLIFPAYLGQMAGNRILPAYLGFIVTGVGLPLLAVIAFSLSRSSNLLQMANRVGKGFGMFFTCALYLTIGPLFAIPRCATTSFTVGIEALAGSSKWALLIFSALFFAIVLVFSLWPGRIMDWIGKLLNPLFLAFFGALIVIALVNPMGAIADIQPIESYQSGEFFNGFLEGYNTMDALAGLAFGIVVVTAVKGLGVENPAGIAKSTAKAGLFSCLLMAIIYGGACIIGTQSRGIMELCTNGGEVLAKICTHYFGTFGVLFLAITVTLACIKTSIGLVTSISESFSEMFSKGKGYRFWATGFCVFSFGISNFGLNWIIRYSLPMLMFLYPLAIALILLILIGRLIDFDKKVNVAVMVCVVPAALLDGLKSLGVMVLDGFATEYLPFYSIGMGWVVPLAVGLVIGLALHFIVKKPNTAVV